MKDQVILVVDDNKNVRETTVLCLEAFGVKAIGAEGPTQALELIAAGIPGLTGIITDYEMPGMSGTDFVRTIKGHEALISDDVYIVMITGRDLRADQRKELLNYGVAALFRKPFSDFELIIKTLSGEVEAE